MLISLRKLSCRHLLYEGGLEMEDSIPKIIHYCWFGDKKIDKKTENIINEWKNKFPDYQFVLWNEENFDISKNTFTKFAYSNKKWAFVTDYVRIYALQKYGGIYLDTDVKIIKNFDLYLRLDGFMSLESSSSLCTAVIGAKKNNPSLLKILNYYNNLDINNFIFLPNSKIIFDIFSKGDIKSFNDRTKFDTIDIFPIDYFCAHDVNLNRFYITKNTVCVHLGNASWYSKKHRILRFIKRIYLKIFRRSTND